MAENTVVKEQLSAEMIEAGAELTAELDVMDPSITASLWLFEPEINEWRLLIASPEVSKSGRRDIYHKIGLARRALGEKAAAVPMSLISVVDSNQELVQLFRIAVRTGAGVSRVRFSKNVINGHFIDDALIYRVA